MCKKILTISIAAYNVADCLPICLDSLISASSFDKLDIVIVNDGSSDDTPTVAGSYASRYPQSIRVVNKPNGGHGSTINAGIDAALGKYFIVLDADDWFETANLDKLVSDLEHSEADCVLNPYYQVDASTKAKTLISYTEHAHLTNSDSAYITEEALNNLERYEMHTITLRSDIARKMRSIDEHCFFVDVEFAIFPLPFIHTYLMLSYPVYCYLLGTDEQSVSRKNKIKRIDNHERVLKSLMSFYDEHHLELSDPARALAKKRISSMARNNYRIYLDMNPASGSEGIVNFDRELKANPLFYKSCMSTRRFGLVELAVPILRITGFRGLSILRRVLPH